MFTCHFGLNLVKYILDYLASFEEEFQDECQLCNMCWGGEQVKFVIDIVINVILTVAVHVQVCMGVLASDTAELVCHPEASGRFTIGR